jgi:hypothetical protein
VARAKKSDPTVSYDDFKEYEGRKYTGMKIGRSHKWYYDQGEWKETKVTPDLWQISYAVTKRRAGKAPEGSGVPVGTEYHWYILAHQNVQKINANDYTTSLSGLKFKIAHKRADTEKWSASSKAQRRRMIKFLQGVIEDLEREDEAPADAQATLGLEEAPSKANGRPAKRRGATVTRTRAKKAAGAPSANGRRSREPATPRSIKKPAQRSRKKSAV